MYLGEDASLPPADVPGHDPDFDFADTELGEEANLIPLRVKNRKSYYGFFTSVMQDRLKAQAEMIGRAPSREEFMKSFRMIQDLMDVGDAILATRHARQSLNDGGSIVDGLVRVGGGSKKRILSRGEAVSSKRKKKIKKQKMPDPVTAFVRPEKSFESQYII